MADRPTVQPPRSVQVFWRFINTNKYHLEKYQWWLVYHNPLYVESLGRTKPQGQSVHLIRRCFRGLLATLVWVNNNNLFLAALVNFSIYTVRSGGGEKKVIPSATTQSLGVKDPKANTLTTALRKTAESKAKNYSILPRKWWMPPSSLHWCCQSQGHNRHKLHFLMVGAFSSKIRALP